ncbi:MAG: hypothetical protein H0V68_09925, partial [Actinobacteria bacterium]|nr:hypothetical protein [Actinomycetota bacterium]
NGGDGTSAQAAVAVAANVELRPDDDADGLPLSTLETLPPDGVVIVANFVARGDQVYYDERFPTRTLPLDVRAAIPGIEYGVQVRPGRPLGQYQLRAAVNHHNVDLNIYFGTETPSPALFAEAQRQLDRLVVRAERVPTPTLRPARAAPVATDPSRIVDRTLICSTVSDFGERLLRIAITPAMSLPSGQSPARASIGTGSAGTREVLAGITAGPSFSRPGPGSAYFNKSRCRATAMSVPLTSRGLPSPPVLFDQYLKCRAGARVLVRVRAVLDRRVAWRATRDLVEARGNSSTAALAVRTETGKPIAYFTLESGKTRLWTVGSCTR